MDGVTDPAMRALQGESGVFSYAVSEFLRVSSDPLPIKVFRRDVPELDHAAKTPSGMPVHVQLLGGDPERMARSAQAAMRAGATVIDINFGCPAPTVNRNDGGATLLKFPCRIREVVQAVRQSLPSTIPVSAKLRLGWDSVEAIYENAEMAAAGGASWITIHARTRSQGYQPPVFWRPIGQVREKIGIPVVANGDIWTLDDFRRCREETGCAHFMLGRCALADPNLPKLVAHELGIGMPHVPASIDWAAELARLLDWMRYYGQGAGPGAAQRLKQWLKLAASRGVFQHFDQVKLADSAEELLALLRGAAPLLR